jgi:dipeptidyl aminopeptidase/acylaminoacyl peptidase
MKLKYCLSALITTVIILSHSDASAIQETSLETLIAPNLVEKPAMSPDGQHIAMIKRIKEGDNFISLIAVHRLNDMSAVSLVRLPKFEVPNRIFWVTNQRLLIEKATERGRGVAPVLTGEIYAYNIDGKRQEYLFGYQMMRMSNRGEHHGNDYAVGFVRAIPQNSEGKFYIRSEDDETDKVSLILIDAFNASRKLIHAGNDKSVQYFFGQKRTPAFMYKINKEKGEISVASFSAPNEWKTSKIAEKIDSFSLIAESTESYYAYFSEHGEAKKLIRVSKDLSHFDVVFQSDSEISILELDKDNKPFAVVGTVGRPKNVIIDFMSDDAETYRALTKQFPDYVLKVVSASEDNRYWLVSVFNDKDPGYYFVFDRQSGKSGAAIYPNEAIDPDKMAANQPIKFTARDGTELHGYLTMQPPKAGEKRPLILLPHGGPIGINDHWYFDRDAQLLADHGYAVLRVNFRGSGGRGVTFEKQGYRNYDKKIIDDLIDGVVFAGTMPGVDNKKVCAYGGSFGAYASVMITVKAPGLLKCAAGISGAYDFSAIVKNDGGSFTNFYKKAIGDNEESLKAISPITYVDKMNTPLFLAHGGADHITSAKQAFAFHDALNAAGKTHEWMFFDNEEHGFYDFENTKLFYRKLLTFLDKHLRP